MHCFFFINALSNISLFLLPNFPSLLEVESAVVESEAVGGWISAIIVMEPVAILSKTSHCSCEGRSNLVPILMTGLFK